MSIPERCLGAALMLVLLAGTGLADGVYYGNPPAGKLSTYFPRFHTPGCSYGEDPSVSDPAAELPPLLLEECTQEIPLDSAVDLRGLWSDGQGGLERIEQCGLRIIIIGGGVIHDFYLADGTVENGVNPDVSFVDCSTIYVAAVFNVTTQTVTLLSDGTTPLVTRERIDYNNMQWIHPVAGVVNYTLVTPESDIGA